MSAYIEKLRNDKGEPHEDAVHELVLPLKPIMGWSTGVSIPNMGRSYMSFYF
jgi:hypothetical protein